MEKLWSERDLIKVISQSSACSLPGLIRGIGDDCAIIKQGSNEHFVVTTDMLVEAVHFNLKWHPPFELGRKAIAVNLSDIAAMGGTPCYIFMAIALPDSLEPRLSQLQTSMAAVWRAAIQFAVNS